MNFVYISSSQNTRTTFIISQKQETLTLVCSKKNTVLKTNFVLLFNSLMKLFFSYHRHHHPFPFPYANVGIYNEQILFTDNEQIS